MTEHYVCEFCGAQIRGADVHKFDERIMCEDCLNEHTTICDCCLDRIWCDDAEGNSTYTLCHYCYENNYTTCSECGELIHNDDAHYSDYPDETLCRECYNKLYETIHNYYFKPSPLFYGGEGSLFMGVELEIDKGGESNTNAQEIIDVANVTDEHIYCKHDGSLDDGFEIVSHPMTLEYHMNTMKWRDILTRAVELGYTSHNAGSCGLHIHCNRSFFGEDYEKQELAIGRIVYLTERFWNELVRFSRRTLGSLNRWAAKYATISETVTETYEKAKNKDVGRYVAVNLSNFATIEFRMFRGTLRYETFIATLQLVDEICRLAAYSLNCDIESLSWSEFVRRINRDEKPELISYLKSRQLYINEITTETEEY